MTFSQLHPNLAKNLVISIICATTIAAITSIIVIFLNHRPIDIQSEIASISAEYYEQYFFPDLEQSIHIHSNSPIADTLSQYTATGLSRVPLRQIIAHTHHDETIVHYITTHCDENTTFVHFFPEPPFTSSSYHITYDYSCNF